MAGHKCQNPKIYYGKVGKESMAKPEFGQVYEESYNKILRMAIAKVGRDEAEDLTQDTFLKGFKAYNRYEDRGFPYISYIRTIARNIITDYQRVDRQHKEVSIETITTFASDDPHPDASKSLRVGSALSDAKTENNPELAYERHEMVGKLKEALAVLKPDQKEAIYLRYIKGLRYEVIAEIMGVSSSAARIDVHRGLKVLRKTMEGGWKE